MAADRIRYVGRDEHHLPSGRPVAFGEENITVGHSTDDTTFDVTPDEAQRLITAGVAVPLPKPTSRRDKPQNEEGNA